jgi:dephospho-CoA kinase
MIRIALVGDIGSGKSYLGKLFKYPTFNADKAVSEIYKKDLNCFKKIKKTLPKFFNSFPIKKKELINAILFNKKNIKKISKIVHPLVRKKMINFINTNKNKKFVILDVPLFLENKLEKKSDIIIFVQSNKLEINKRLKTRKNFNIKILKKLKTLQLPLKTKKKRAEFIIKNDFKKKSVKKEITKILKLI